MPLLLLSCGRSLGSRSPGIRRHPAGVWLPKSIAIIGAGISGLAAGCYAQMNGYQSRIFEMRNIPGGLCTAWERRGYTFDGCLHYFFSSGEGKPSTPPPPAFRSSKFPGI